MFNPFKRKPTFVAEPPKPVQLKLPNFVSTYYDEIDAERSKVKCEIDFDAAKAAGFVTFSVERSNIGTDDECTIVSFIEERSTPLKTHEWTLYCSRDQHNKIAAQLCATTKGAPNKKTTNEK